LLSLVEVVVVVVRAQAVVRVDIGHLFLVSHQVEVLPLNQHCLLL